MPINIAFAGSRIKRPGAYSTVDTSGMVPITLGAFNVLAFVGKMDASATLEAKKAHYFNDPAIARKAIKKGDFMEALDVAWGHSADLICVVRVDEATQATGVIKGSADEEVFAVTAKPFGTTGNDITYDIDVDIDGNKTLNFAQGKLLEQFKVTSGATNAEIADMISKRSQLVTLEAKSTNPFETPMTPMNLTGGTGGGEVTDQDWQEAIDVLVTEEVQGLVAVTTAPAIIAKMDAHIANMSTVKNRKERRGFYGHENYMPIADIIDIKMMVNNERGLIASPGVYIYGESGEQELRSSVLLASAYAGLWSSKEPQDPITYDYVKFAGLEKRYNAVEIEQLLDGGIAVTEFVKGRGYRIVQGITTDTGVDVTKTELSVSTLKDVMSINLRNHLEEKFVGKAGVKGIEITIYNDVVTMIQKFEKAGWISGYVEDSIKVIKDGTTFTVDWEGKPTLPINNFLITSHFTL